MNAQATTSVALALFAQMDGQELREVARMLRPYLLELDAKEPSAVVDVDPDRLYTVREAAQYLRCGVRRIYDATSAGRLKVTKDGGRNLYRRRDLDALLESEAAA